MAGDDTNAADEVVLQALGLLGVRYRWGGNDPGGGLDCSGFVRHVFKSVASLELPRRSEDMSRVGHSVAFADLRAGDLLFFNTLGRRNSHVALYIGEGRFVHAPGHNGRVRVEGLLDRYWRKRFNGARRVDLASADPTVVAEHQPKSHRDDLPNGP